MKLALITDPKGFSVIRLLGLSYHLVLAQYVRTDSRYSDFYADCHAKGDFIIMDNGAAEDTTLQLHELQKAAEYIRPDEIVLPDVMTDMEATLKASLDARVLGWVPPVKRAVVPQGNSFEEWFECANRFIKQTIFATICIPKHAERFEGGRVRIIEAMMKRNWHLRYNIHLLGIWGEPYTEMLKFQEYTHIVRGIDSAAPMAFAQANIPITDITAGHIHHVWSRKFNKATAVANTTTLMTLAQGYE